MLKVASSKIQLLIGNLNLILLYKIVYRQYYRSEIRDL